MVLQKSVYEERARLLGGGLRRWERTPRARMMVWMTMRLLLKWTDQTSNPVSGRNCRESTGRAGSRCSERWGSESSADTDDVLDAFLLLCRGSGIEEESCRVGGRRLAAACGLGHCSCLDWVAEQLQWGAVGGEGPLQDLLGQLQFDSRVGLVDVLLWRQRQRHAAQLSCQGVAASATLPRGRWEGSRTVERRQKAVPAAHLAGDMRMQQ